MSKKKIVIVTGCTGSGKTSLVHDLFNYGNIIINSDSVQFYKYFNIGSAKPSHSEIADYNYKLIDFIDPSHFYNANDFFRDALNIIKETDERVFVVGGSIMYINILRDGIFNYPEGITNEIILSHRHMLNKLLKDRGIKYLLNLLKDKDPEYYNIVDKNNHRRIIRALEIIFSTGLKYSELRKNRITSDTDFLTIVLNPDKQILKNNIKKRTKKMIDDGLIDEVRQLSKKYNTCLPVFNTIGYKETIMYFDGKIRDEKSLEEEIDKNTMHLVKKQKTWFKKLNAVLTIDDLSDKNINKIKNTINKFYT